MSETFQTFVNQIMKLTMSTEKHNVYLTCGWFKLYSEEPVQYLVILDKDTELHHSLSYRDGDVPSVWTEILNGRVGTLRNLDRRRQ